ncbi:MULTISPECIES: MFS transporter [unclassified Paenibacillus]|uniref:MFS transporter n=1 Tax=unclassified Paenibacillus TaxID=185978 RepID=UPI000954CC09|nr:MULTISPECIES: MFS transporter [unclassified Paenibacillus]ASS66807.1 MFS transporter [Paenibacillus sp. RUD330]SIP94787.1 MFS transporter, FSR family, fosmidomycin resistance protein [Paenibacillus sp. RU4X]SIQ13228.1 MFS transporter, FSR family, fosmidomycin resistance protein [Paenibacillus sp. RU4T]
MSQAVARKLSTNATLFPILFMISTVHLLNDSMQSTVTALFPVLRETQQLSYGQIGLIAFMMNITASFLQPLVGLFADKKPRPYILPLGVCFTLIGVIGLSLAPSFAAILLSVTAIGVGSAVFHPESSRVAYLAAGTSRGLAQSIFQVGGNIGSALGPVMTALIFIPLGQKGVLLFVIAALAGIAIQTVVARWYGSISAAPRPKAAAASAAMPKLSSGKVKFTIGVLVLLVFSKHVYLSSFTSFYSLYLIDDFGIGKQSAQWYLFAFLVASAIGTFIGGPLADRFGRRNIIWLSILGTAPFSLMLPYANPFWSAVLCVCAGFVLSSAFSIIVVYAQELLPGKIGLVSGLFFGLAFGLGGLGSALLGEIADATSIGLVMRICSYLPLLGIFTLLLPKDAELRGQSK